MTGPSGEVRITLDPSPEVQLLGDVVLIKGRAAIDAYRRLTEGISLVRARDAIEPSPRLLQTVAALKVAATANRQVVAADIADVRKPSTRPSLRSGEVVGTKEVAHMLGLSHRQVRRLAPSLGGRRGTGGGKPWTFDRGLVNAYLDQMEIS